MITRTSRVRELERRFEREREWWRRQIAELNDRLAHAYDKDWMPPPMPEREYEPDYFADIDVAPEGTLEEDHYPAEAI